MENQMQTVNAAAPQREISVVTAEVLELKIQAQKMAVGFAIEIGRRLTEAKSILPHGAWGDWLEKEVEFSQSTARNYMLLFAEYGNQQLTLFGGMVNSQALEKLDYTKALKLLAIPAEEREAFIEEVDAAHISTRELEEAIRERNEARAQAEEERRKAAEYEEKLEDALTARDEARELSAQAEELLYRATRAEKDLADVSRKLNDALENPKIPDGERFRIEKAARQQAEAAGAKKLEEAQQKAKKEAEAAAKKAAKELAEAQAKAEEARNKQRAAEMAADKARMELEELRNKTKLANPDVAAFKTMFDALQGQIGKIRELLKKIGAEDPATAEKLGQALAAVAAQLTGSEG